MLKRDTLSKVTDQSNEYSTNSLLPQLHEILPLDDHTDTPLQNTQNELKSNSDEIHLKINPEYKELSYDPALIHYNIIKTSIEKNGQYNKITTNEKGEILDGHKRFRACTELNIIPQVEVKSFESKEDEEEFVIECNLARTNHSKYERVKLTEKLRPIYKKQAQLRQEAGKPTFTQYCVKDPHYYETDSFLARKAGISTTTYRKCLAIMNSDNGRLKDDVENEKISISKAYNEFRKSTQKIIPREIPKIKYSVILANPKWVDRESSSTKCIDYPQIIKSCSSENAVLVLHINNKHIPDAIDLIRNSGFEYHRIYSINTKSSKFFIVAKRGKITLPDLEFDSDKEIHEIIEDAFPDQKCIELWTNTPHNDKWTAWNETVTVSVPENTPEWKRPMQSTLTEMFDDFWRSRL